MEDPSGMWNAETEEVSENEADPQESGLYYTVKVTAPDGIQVHATGSPEQLVIENPQLWWPNGYGRQDLYTVEVTLCFEGKELDCWKRRIGLRTMTVDRSKMSGARILRSVSMAWISLQWVPTIFRRTICSDG